MADTELLNEAAGEVPAWLARRPLLLAVPSLLLGGGALLDAWVSPLHSAAPAAVSLVLGALWGAYLRMAMGACGGVERGGLATPVALMVLAFLGLEYGGPGLLLPVLAWVLPIMDFAVMYGEAPDGALAGLGDTARSAPLLWPLTTLLLLLGLVMLALVLSLPGNLYASTADRESGWIASVTGGVLVGPLVHAAVVFRARLFLAIHGDPA